MPPEMFCQEVWPKLGYDAVIEPDTLKKMQVDLDAIGMNFAAARLRISDLWDRGHFDLWEKYGSVCIMEFDVSSKNSWSMRRIAEVIGNEGL